MQAVCFRSLLANLQGWDSDSILSENVDAENVGLQKKPEVEHYQEPSTPHSNGCIRLHEFVSKTVMDLALADFCLGYLRPWPSSRRLLSHGRLVY